MSKYASASDTAKIISCYESIPAQHAKDNKKFQYEVERKGGSASIFGDSIEWLNSAGVIIKCLKTQGLYVAAVDLCGTGQFQDIYERRRTTVAQ